MPAKFQWTPERVSVLLTGLEGGSQQWAIAEKLGCSVNTVERKIREFREIGIELPTQRTGPRAGEGHPEWRGGRVIDEDGYVLIYAPWHPHARKNGRKSGGRYIAEHRLVMEQKIGRLLERGEVVHHIDGNKQNNHPDNLELFSKNSDHLKHELTGRCPKWTEEGLARIRAGVEKARHINRKKSESGASRSPENSPHSSESPET